MTIIYFRHGDDEVSDPTKTHDHKITDEGKKDARKFAKKLIKKYGQPQRVYLGPFARTKETYAAMKKYLDSDVEIIIEPRLSRYFSSKEKKHPKVYTSTKKYKPPIQETHSEFHERVEKHYSKLKKDGWLKEDKLTWCITHALVLKHTAKQVDITLPERYDFLECFAIKSKGKKVVRAK